MDDPFAPPELVPSGDMAQAVVVVGTWGMAGACLGAGLGAGLAAPVAPLALGGSAGLGLVGALAFFFEHRAAGRRKALVDSRGRLVRPLSTWVSAVPIALGGVGVAILVALWSAHTRSFAPAAAFAGVFGVLGLVVRPMAARRALTSAVVLIEQGEPERARRVLEGLERGLLPTRPVREMARFNLGLIAIYAGDLDDAAVWFQRAGCSAHAATGLALVRAVQGAFSEADALLGVASRAKDARHAHAEIEGVRLLLVLRQDGAGEARQLGERRMGPDAGALFQAVLAAARSGDGDEQGADELLRVESVQATIEAGVGLVVPELQALRWRVGRGV